MAGSACIGPRTRAARVGVKRAVATMAVCVLAGCSGNSGLTTTASTAPPPVVDDSATRVAQVSWTAARAEKCGFVLDEPKLKANYLAYESLRGTDPAALSKVDQAYAVSRKILAAKIAAAESYCNDRVVDEVRGDLARYLAGDYAARATRPAIEEG